MIGSGTLSRIGAVVAEIVIARMAEAERMADLVDQGGAAVAAIVAATRWSS